jgi:hypothetical protein
VKGKVELNLKKYPDFSLRTSSLDKSIQFQIENRIYELTIQPNQTLELELVFSPSGVASYEFDLPIVINKPENDMKFNQENYDQLISNTPYLSEFQASTMREKFSSNNSKSSRHTTLVDLTKKKRVLAVGLRKALELSTTGVSFKVPIRYYEKLKEGGFYEAKSVIMTNRSHRPVKWCIDMRKSNQVLEDGIFKICDGSMIPFVTRDKNSIGPEGEIKQDESYEIKILFCPGKFLV